MLEEKDIKGYLLILKNYINRLLMVKINLSGKVINQAKICQIAEQIGLKVELCENFSEACQILNKTPDIEQFFISGS